MTRSEHHADADAHTVRESRRTVRQALETYAVGRENALPGTALADLTPLKATTVRDIVAELRDDADGPPIGQCSDGYYVLSDADELQAWIEGVQAEIQTKRERLEANVQSYNKRHHSNE
jgi:predicted TIM-barrel enzyme